MAASNAATATRQQNVESKKKSLCRRGSLQLHHHLDFAKCFRFVRCKGHMYRYGLKYTKPCHHGYPEAKNRSHSGDHAQTSCQTTFWKVPLERDWSEHTERDCAYGLCYPHLCEKYLNLQHAGRYLGNAGRWWGCFKGNNLTLSNYTWTAHRAGTAVCRLKGSRCAHVRIRSLFILRQVFICRLLPGLTQTFIAYQPVSLAAGSASLLLVRMTGLL